MSNGPMDADVRPDIDDARDAAWISFARENDFATVDSYSNEAFDGGWNAAMRYVERYVR